MKNYTAAKLFLAYLCICSLVLSFFYFNSVNTKKTNRLKIAQVLTLTQLVVSCEAKHLRDFVFEDYISAFQDFPGYHDHFAGAPFLKSRDFAQKKR